MTVDQREAEFQRHLSRTVAYFDAVRAAGDLPWFEDPEKLAGLGLADRPGEDARRVLFMRRYR